MQDLATRLAGAQATQGPDDCVDPLGGIPQDLT
jgi:hypothetical protein